MLATARNTATRSVPQSLEPLLLDLVHLIDRKKDLDPDPTLKGKHNPCKGCKARSETNAH